MKTDRVGESLTKSMDSATFAANDLRNALKHATPVEGIVILKLIDAAAQLARSIDTLIEARQ